MKTKSKVILLADDMEREDSQDQTRSQAVRSIATELAKNLNSSIELVHVEDLNLYPVSKPYHRKQFQDFISQRKYKLKKAAHSLKVPVHTSLIEGDPIETLT